MVDNRDARSSSRSSLPAQACVNGAISLWCWLPSVLQDASWRSDANYAAARDGRPARNADRRRRTARPLWTATIGVKTSKRINAIINGCRADAEQWQPCRKSTGQSSIIDPGSDNSGPICRRGRRLATTARQHAALRPEILRGRATAALPVVGAGAAAAVCARATA